MVSHLGSCKTYTNCAEVWLPFQNTTHSECLHACFALKFPSPGRWEWLLASVQKCFIICVGFLHHKDTCTWDVLLLALFHTRKKIIDVSDLEICGEKCCLQPVLITDLLLQNHGVDQLLPALLWGCLRPGSRLEHMALLFVPHCVCRAVWPDLLLIYLPDNSSSLEEVMRTSWPYQTLSHPNCLSPPHPPTTFMLLSLVWGLKDLSCILAVPSFSVAEEAKANFCFGGKNVCGQVGKSLCFWHIWMDVETVCLERINCICRLRSGDTFIQTGETDCYLDA